MQSDQNSILATQIGVPFCDQRNWLHWEIYFGSPTIMRNNRFRPGSGYEVVAGSMTSNFIQLAAPWEPKNSLIFRGLLFTHILVGLQPSWISWVFWGPKLYIYIHTPLIHTIGRYYFTSHGRLPINQEADKSIDISAASQCTVHRNFHVWMIFVTKNHPEKVAACRTSMETWRFRTPKNKPCST